MTAPKHSPSLPGSKEPEEPEFNFRSADIGITTAVKNPQFRPQSPVQLPPQPTKTAKSASFSLRTFLAPLFSTPLHRFITIGTITVALLISVATLFLLNRKFSAPSQSTPSEIHTQLISAATNTYHSGGDGYLEKSITPILTQIRLYNHSRDFASAHALVLSATDFFMSQNEHASVIDIFQSIDLTHLTPAQRCSYHLSFASTLSAIPDQSSLFDQQSALTDQFCP